MKKSLYATVLILIMAFNKALAQEQPIKKQQGISFTSVLAVNSWDEYEAFVFMAGYRQRKVKRFSSSPYISGGAGFFQLDGWGTWPGRSRYSYAMFIDGGMCVTLDAEAVAIRNFTNLTVNYSPAQWAGTDLGMGLSTTFAFGSGSALKNVEVNLLFPGVDFYILGKDINGRQRPVEAGVGGAMRLVGFHLVYYFPGN